MKMCVEMVMPATAIPPVLNKWLDECLPLDIKLRRGERRNGVLKGQKMVCFTVYGDTQDDIMDKISALEQLIEKTAKQ